MLFSQECATPIPANYQTYERTKQERGFDKANIQLHPEICLNVYYHIVRRDDGTGEFSENQLSDMTNLLNQEFNPHNIFFNPLGNDFIDSTAYYNISDDIEFYALITTNNQPNAINIYIVNSAPYHGKAKDVGSQELVIRKEYTVQATLAHEVGHCLNLFHTHHGTVDEGDDDPNECPELINGTNSAVCGDYIADTPADDSFATDNGYSPDLTNLMSYYSPRDHFTIGQELRMRDAIFANPVLQAVVGNSCGIVAGDPVTCASITTVFTLTNADPPYNWTVSSNLQIDASSGNTITVSAINNQTRALGFIDVTYGNGGQEHYPVWVGKPLSPASLNGPTEVDTGALVAYQGGIAEGATTYQWFLPYPFDVVTTMDYFGDNWQMFANNTRSISHVFTGYGEDGGYVQLMGVNKCGVGGVTILEVVHDNCTGSGCGAVPVPPNPVPNASDTDFKLDFSNYPPGTYYIYIYDANATTMYAGESSNVEKTVSTINIPNGTYFLHIYDSNGVTAQQLIINH